jgi:HEPN domain-containing protein
VKVSTIELLANNAEAFWQAARSSVKDTNEMLTEGKYNPALVSNLTVGATNISFAVELYFKAINMAITQKNEFGHDLLKLYQKLPKETQDDITRIYLLALKEYKSDLKSFRVVISSEENKDNHMKNNPIDSENLDLLLRRHSKTFIRWRYMHEVKSDPLLHADFPRLECLFMAVRNTFFSESVKHNYKLTTQH